MELMIPRPAVFVEEAPPEPSPDGIDCPLCQNRGYTVTKAEDGSLLTRECACMARRRSEKRMRRSGLGDLLRRCTFASMRCPDTWSRELKAAALRYAQDGQSPWFYVSGRPGTGKTHACTAICGRLLKSGAAVRYLLWREEIPVLKALVSDSPEAYAARMEELYAAPVLYIDDFCKGKVTDADLNLAFALINARYNRDGCRTIFSSERNLADIGRLDEAVASRIRQRAGGYILAAPPGAKNWRLEGREEDHA